MKYLIERNLSRIAKLFYLRLPSCHPGFESQAHHLHFYHLHIVKFVLYLSRDKYENKHKEAGLGPYKKRKSVLTGNERLTTLKNLSLISVVQTRKQLEPNP